MSRKHILPAVAATVAALGLAVAPAASASAAAPVLRVVVPADATTSQPVTITVSATPPDDSPATVNLRLAVPNVPAFGRLLGSVSAVAGRAEMVVPAHSLPVGEDEIVAAGDGATARAYIEVWQASTIQTLAAIQIGRGQMRVSIQVTAGQYAPAGFVQLKSVTGADIAGAIPVPGPGVFSVTVPVPPNHSVTATFVPGGDSYELPARRSAPVRPRPTGGIVIYPPPPPFSSGFPVPPPAQRAVP